jgi:hypothetical protein
MPCRCLRRVDASWAARDWVTDSLKVAGQAHGTSITR